MTRINTVDVKVLTDQHLMAEYRELPMVLAAARRSRPEKFVPSHEYTLNKGHVKFFYDKRAWLESRYSHLINELRNRGYNINPESRVVEFSNLDKFPQTPWAPNIRDIGTNRARLVERIAAKPRWYRFHKKPLTPAFIAEHYADLVDKIRDTAPELVDFPCQILPSRPVHTESRQIASRRSETLSAAVR